MPLITEYSLLQYQPLHGPKFTQDEHLNLGHTSDTRSRSRPVKCAKKSNPLNLNTHRIGPATHILRTNSCWKNQSNQKCRARQQGVIAHSMHNPTPFRHGSSRPSQGVRGCSRRFIIVHHSTRDSNEKRCSSGDTNIYKHQKGSAEHR